MNDTFFYFNLFFELAYFSFSCVLSELLLHDPLFPARTELELIDKIIDTIGSPNETIWPGYSDLPLVKEMAFDLLA